MPPALLSHIPRLLCCTVSTFDTPGPSTHSLLLTVSRQACERTSMCSKFALAVRSRRLLVTHSATDLNLIRESMHPSNAHALGHEVRSRVHAMSGTQNLPHISGRARVLRGLPGVRRLALALARPCDFGTFSSFSYTRIPCFRVSSMHSQLSQ